MMFTVRCIVVSMNMSTSIHCIQV